MIRAALLLGYLIAVLSGPRPCCCATPQPPVDRPAVPEKKPACPLCAAEKKPEPKPTPPTKKHQCPCPKAGLKAPVVARTGDDARSVLVLDAIHSDPPPRPVHAGDALVVVPGPPPEPSPQLARLCHRLRC